jgi:hypothetical protein
MEEGLLTRTYSRGGGAMPEKVIESMKRGYRGSDLSSKEINHRVYGHLNNVGAMHGSKETRKGAAMERKYEADEERSEASDNAREEKAEGQKRVFSGKRKS